MADLHRSDPVTYNNLHRVPLKRIRGGPPPSRAAQLVVFIALLPLGATFVGLAGVTFFVTLSALAVATPVLLVFSPIIVPAAIVMGLLITMLLFSGVFGLSGLTSLNWVLNYFRSMRVSTLYGAKFAQIGL